MYLANFDYTKIFYLTPVNFTNNSGTATMRKHQVELKDVQLI